MGGFFAIEGALGVQLVAKTCARRHRPEPESAEVDGDARSGAYFCLRADGIGWRDVHRAAEPLRAIKAPMGGRKARRISGKRSRILAKCGPVGSLLPRK